jgi:hypothetical protein
MIKRFNQFVFESKYDTLASSYAKDVFDFVKKTSAVPVNRIKTIVLDYQEPIEFSVNVKVVRVHEFKPAAIPDFVNMPWESINFEEKGYAVDANAFIPKASDPDSPEIDVVIHYQLPLKEDAMVHRNGRTARMEAEGEVYFLLDEKDHLPDFLESKPAEIQLPVSFQLPNPPQWKTLFTKAGKKDKINKMDIVGMLLQKAKLNKDELGVLDWAAADVTIVEKLMN